MKVALFVLLLSTVASASPATDAIKACAPYRDLIADAVEAASVPAALLTALVFAESTCNPNAVNAKTGAVGLGQILATGAGQGHTPNELREPWLNLSLSAGYLATWRKRCGSWRGAVEVYGGRAKCSARSSQGAKIVRLWKAITKAQEVRS